MQIVYPIKRFAKPFYKSADYASGDYIKQVSEKFKDKIPKVSE